MKSILIGALAAFVIAAGAYLLLDTKLQQTASERFTTEAVRL